LVHANRVQDVKAGFAHESGANPYVEGKTETTKSGDTRTVYYCSKRGAPPGAGGADGSASDAAATRETAVPTASGA
jgi:hypothetical protein